MVTKIQESRAALKDLDKSQSEIILSYEVWARLIETHGVMILRDFKGYHDEKLSGNLKDCRSSRLNRKWRVIYRVTRDDLLEIVEVCRVTPHVYRS